MQERQNNRTLYFEELATTSRKYFIPYISRFKRIEPGMNVLEIGCGDGGNLLPFAQRGCHTVGVDLSEGRIRDAIRFFAKAKAQGTFIASDIFELQDFGNRFDLIICHDVFEHIRQKERFLSCMQRYVKHKGGVIFMSFPAWQMPFGGHQQICHNPILSHLPFIHLLPSVSYRLILTFGKERQRCIDELLEIKQTGISIERFEQLTVRTHLEILNRELYFINPHYEIKFGLRPRKLYTPLAAIPYLRNFFTTSCFYMLKYPE